MSSSVGIIGGADGPTAIFLAEPADGSLLIAGLVLALAAAALWLHRRRKK